MNRATCALTAVIALAAVALSGGCESTPGPMPPMPSLVTTVDYGVFPDDYETLVDEWVRDRTGDSVVISDVQVTEPERGWYRAPVAPGAGATTYGYKSFVSFSRNAQPGDLLSRHRYLMVFREGRIAIARPADELKILGEDE